MAARDRHGRAPHGGVRIGPSWETQARTPNDNDRNPLMQIEPHYEEITRSDEVQRSMSPLLRSLSSRPTTGSPTATQYLKDNRLLPRGFDKKTVGAVMGVSGAPDPILTSPTTVICMRYRIGGASSTADTPSAAERRYQSIGYRWAPYRADYDAPEPKRFASNCTGDVLGLVGDDCIRDRDNTLEQASFWFRQPSFVLGSWCLVWAWFRGPFFVLGPWSRPVCRRRDFPVPGT